MWYNIFRFICILQTFTIHPNHKNMPAPTSMHPPLNDREIDELRLEFNFYLSLLEGIKDAIRRVAPEDFCFPISAKPYDGGRITVVQRVSNSTVFDMRVGNIPVPPAITTLFTDNHKESEKRQATVPTADHMLTLTGFPKETCEAILIYALNEMGYIAPAVHRTALNRNKVLSRLSSNRPRGKK